MTGASSQNGRGHADGSATVRMTPASPAVTSGRRRYGWDVDGPIAVLW
jgi:hypothetical protein